MSTVEERKQEMRTDIAAGNLSANPEIKTIQLQWWQNYIQTGSMDNATSQKLHQQAEEIRFKLNPTYAGSVDGNSFVDPTLFNVTNSSGTVSTKNIDPNAAGGANTYTLPFSSTIAKDAYVQVPANVTGTQGNGQVVVGNKSTQAVDPYRDLNHYAMPGSSFSVTPLPGDSATSGIPEEWTKYARYLLYIMVGALVVKLFKK